MNSGFYQVYSALNHGACTARNIADETGLTRDRVLEIIEILGRTGTLVHELEYRGYETRFYIDPPDKKKTKRSSGDYSIVVGAQLRRDIRYRVYRHKKGEVHIPDWAVTNIRASNNKLILTLSGKFVQESAQPAINALLNT